MSRIAKLAIAIAAPLLLSGCFLIPGKFVSSLDLRKDGNFTFAYKGELIFQNPDEAMKGPSEAEVWSDDKASCYSAVDAASGAADAAADAAMAAAEAAGDAMKDSDAGEAAIASEISDGSRPCTKKEIAEQRKDWEQSQKDSAERKQKDNEGFGALFGYTPGDDAANTRFAQRLVKFEGWKAATYQGKGKFLVDYRFTGKVGHDFIFPVMPDGDVIFPFVQIRKREAGKVLVNTPSLIGGGMMAMWSRVGAMGGAGNNDKPKLEGIIDGSFTLTTDGEILTNNSEDGPTSATNGKSLTWKIDASGKRIPEALIQLQ